ncbi:nitroreductase [Bacteroidia bacterium]|nr:nitroreductase [Bacteroidia bacterium]
MSIIESIHQRRSVRNYTGEPLIKEHAEGIENFINNLETPFGASVRINLLHTTPGEGKVKLGTYGVIGGARDYLTLVYKEGPLVEESAAYMFEQVILYCTSLGLGTCWLGGSFSRKDFKDQLNLQPDEKLRIVSPVGYPSEKKRLWDSIIGADGNHSSRKPFGTLYFYKNFATPLMEEQAGIYREPLEMVRLAPSANNKQSWRVILAENALHFYYQKSLIGYGAIDLGIALAHFADTCHELNILGSFQVLPTVPQSKDTVYSISYVLI